MKRKLTLALVLLTFAFSLTAQQTDKYAPGQLIVMLQNGYSAVNLQSDFQSFGLKPDRVLSQRLNIWLLTFDRSNDAEFVLDTVSKNSKVEVAQFNHFMQLREGVDSKYDLPSNIRETYPNDILFDDQWSLNNTGQTGGTPDADIDAPEAWDLSFGGPTSSGDEIVVAVIDGGCFLAHEDLNFWKNINEIPNNGIDDDANGYIDDYDGWNAYTHTGNIPSHSHGTHVAGIAGAIGNNFSGVAGVDPDVKIMPIAGSSSDEATVVEAYGYVYEMRYRYNQTGGTEGAFVVVTNSSFGVDYGDPANYPIWCGMYDSLGGIGILSCAATANINIDIDFYGDVPTACSSDYLISVTNTTQTDLRNSGAAYGLTTIDLGAPGTNILNAIPNNGYSLKTGTSMATPHVAGAIALMYAAAGQELISAYHNDPAVTALLIKQYLLNGVDPNSSLDGITVTGGRLNLFNSVSLAIEGAGVPVELSSFTAAETDGGVHLIWITATETNNRGFEIERKSMNARFAQQVWREIGSIEGAGNSAVELTYQFDDLSAPAGKYLYRLKQIDFDGAFAYSKVIEVEVASLVDFYLWDNFPNPFNPATTIKFSLPEDSRAKLSIYNLLGEELFILIDDNLSRGIHSAFFDASELSSGSYFYSLLAQANNSNKIYFKAKKLLLIK